MEERGEGYPVVVLGHSYGALVAESDAYLAQIRGFLDRHAGS